MPLLAKIAWIHFGMLSYNLLHSTTVVSWKPNIPQYTPTTLEVVLEPLDIDSESVLAMPKDARLDLYHEIVQAN